jgi:amino acid transporter
VLVERPGEVWVAETELRGGSLGLSGAVMQNVTAIAPAIAAFFFTPTIVGFAGAHAPLAYFLGFLIVLALGTCLVQLARLFPSAGGYFTYVSRAVHPRAGFLTAWMYTLYSPIITGPLLAFFGLILEGELSANYGIELPWWAFVLLALPAITALGHFGIQLSVRTIVVLGSIEFLIVLALGISGLVDPGPGGFTLRAFDPGFNPGDVAGATGFALAVVFTVQGLTGWEAAVPLAEETENPRRNVPIATMASIAVIGLMLVLVIWGQVIGWGVTDLRGLTDSGELPALVLGHRIWGGAWVLLLVAMLTSVIGASLACQNVASRMWFGMARSGALPQAVARVHPAHRTPTVAIGLQCLLSATLGLGLAALVGPEKAFVMVLGFVLVIAVIFVYLMANVGVVLHYWRHQRRRFSWVLHFVFPVGTSAVLVYSLVRSFTPFPEAPYSFSPAIVGAWFLAGCAVLLWFRARGRESWLHRAGTVVAEHREGPDELAELHEHRV